MKALLDKTINSFGWMAAATFLNVLQQIIFISILSRLLSPEEYGLMAIVVLILALLNVISLAGVGPALVQKVEISEAHVGAAFSISSVIAISTALLLVGLSNQVAGFFSMPELSSVLKLAAICVFLDGIGAVSLSLARRDLLFKRIAIRNVASYFISYSFVGVPLAIKGFGVYALLFAHMMQVFINNLLVYLARPHALFKGAKMEAAKDLFRFGVGNTISSVFSRFAVHVDNILVGRIQDAYALGVYSQSYRLMAYPANMFGEIVAKVIFPALSKIQRELHLLRRVSCSADFLLSFFLLPASVLAYFYSPLFSDLVLGPQWGDVGPVLSILSLGIFLRIAYKVDYEMVKAVGKTGLLSWTQLIYFMAVAGLVGYAAYYYDLKAVAIAVLAAMTINYIMLKAAVIFIIKLNLKDFCRAIIPGVIMSFICLALCFFVSLFIVGWGAFFVVFSFVSTSMLLFIYALKKNGFLDVYLSVLRGRRA